MRRNSLFTLIAVILTSLIAVNNANAYDISFDGYCDGMQFDWGAAPPFIFGTRTGCADEELIGIVGPLIIFFWVRDDGAKFITLVMYDGTYEHYKSTDGGPVEFVGDGTWSLGPPTDVSTGKLSSL